MDVMLVVDMQVGLRHGGPKHDLQGVIDRINRLAAQVREQVGIVIFIQHCGRRRATGTPQQDRAGSRAGDRLGD
jgi:nicotinamidase-related amidase